MVSRKNWTLSAINCYKRGGVCAGCVYENFFSNGFKCRMKEALIDLVHTHGVPDSFNPPNIILED